MIKISPEMDKKFYAVMSGKGGVGKSTVSSLLARKLSKRGKTLLVDFDLCGPSISNLFEITGKIIKGKDCFIPISYDKHLDILSFGNVLNENDVVIWRGAKKNVFLDLMINTALMGEYENIVIDTPPGITEEHEFVVNRVPECEIILVTTSQNVALNKTQNTIEYCTSNNMNIIGLIQNMSYYDCEKCRHRMHLYGKNGGELLADEYGIRYLGEIDFNATSSALDEMDLF